MSTVNTMSKSLYGLCVSAFTALGILFAAYMSQISQNWEWALHGGWSEFGFVVGILAVSIAGSVISQSGHDVTRTLIGYVLVAGPLGLLLGPVVAQYTTASVVRIFVLTAVLVVLLGLVGALIPKSLESWGSWLFGALIVLLLGYFAIPLFGLFGLDMGRALTLWDWIGLVVFGGLTIFDLNRAMRLPYTLDNSVKSSVRIFLDFANIFVRALGIGGNSK